MASFQQRKTLLPEEQVRQEIYRLMVEERGFPKSHIIIERELSLLPHMKDQTALPHRRIDLLAYEASTLFPLLLVECKAIKLSDKSLEQALGYNHYIQAPFIAIANQVQIITGWFDEMTREFRFVNRLPHYDELLIKAKSRRPDRERCGPHSPTE